MKDSKSAKVSFLNKVIHLVNVGNGRALEVNASKIVSGLEPINTNILLTTFGRLALDENIDRNLLVQHCLSGKGIDEYIAVKTAEVPSSSLAKDSSTKTTSDDPAERGDVVLVDSAIMEQIRTCNDDMEQTKSMISNIISKPKCSDKLLAKPPFRFIHDLLMAIGKATEFDLGQIFR